MTTRLQGYSYIIENIIYQNIEYEIRNRFKIDINDLHYYLRFTSEQLNYYMIECPNCNKVNFYYQNNYLISSELYWDTCTYCDEYGFGMSDLTFMDEE